ncbi:hypothetical protein B0H14DRAFT_2977269 [Mycena olivaceomarginata]|nr:hypothetical protein B0H14DRAFT_2977269 [Mycena olivaceomarginata]
MAAELHDLIFDPTIVRDVIHYPPDGGAPHITPMRFTAKEAATTSPTFTDAQLYDLEQFATHDRDWSVGDGPNRKARAFRLYYNMNSDLPINLAMARVARADPNNPGERLLWRGDVWVVCMLPEGSSPPAMLGAHYLDATEEDLDLFSSTLIYNWYNSAEWRNFVSQQRLYTLSTHGVFGNDEHFRDDMRRYVEGLKALEARQIDTARTSRTRNFSRDPYETTSRKVILYPAEKHAQPTIVSMTFAERDVEAIPLGFESIDIDVARLYGRENIYAARQKWWCSNNNPELDSNETYTLYYNLNPDLPVNWTMASLVGVDPESPGKRLLWRGDAVVVKWRQWRGEYVDYVDMTPDMMNKFNSKAIPEWYNSSAWHNVIDDEEEFIEEFLKLPGTSLIPWNIFGWFVNRDQATYAKRAQLIKRLKAISAGASNTDGDVD